MNKLTDKQLKAIPHLVFASSLEEGRKQAKIGKATLYEWLKNPDFKDELRRQRDEVVKEALETLKSAITKAVEGMVCLMDSDNENIKQKACKEVIEHTLRVIELDDMERRLTEVEGLLKRGGK